MNNKQETALRCALADLVGAYQAWEQGGCNVHNWDAHALTITELAEAFGMQDEVSDSWIESYQGYTPEEEAAIAEELGAELDADIRADKRENGTGY